MLDVDPYRTDVELWVEATRMSAMKKFSESSAQIARRLFSLAERPATRDPSAGPAC